MSIVQGLSAFPITPSDADGRVDLAALRRLVAPLAAAGVDSIGLLGSTGSYPYFAATSAAAPSTPRSTRRAAACRCWSASARSGPTRPVAWPRTRAPPGPRRGLLAPVSYTPLGDDEVFEHVAAVARAGLPLVVYDNPSTTHFAFTPALVGRVAGSRAWWR